MLVPDGAGIPRVSWGTRLGGVSWGRPSVGVRRWLAGGMARNLRGTAAGLIAAWFNIPFGLLMASVGAVFGGVVGTVSGTVAGPIFIRRINTALTWVFGLGLKAQDLVPSAALQIGGIIGGLIGAVGGALLLGFVAMVLPWTTLTAIDPVWMVSLLLGQLVTGLFVGLLYLVWSVAFEGFRLRITGVRRLSRREAAFLLPILDEVAERLGLEAVPRLMIDDDRTVNAFAASRHVVLHRGLLDAFATDREAVAGVLAHELVHWREGDPVSMIWGRGVALPLYLMYELATRLLAVARWRPLQFVIRILLWSVLVTVRRGVIPIQATVWRAAEYRADAGAAAAGYGEGMRRVLLHLRGSWEVGRSGWDKAICATHPPSELRLERLERPGARYPVGFDEEYSPIRALIGGTDRRSSVQRD